MGIGVRLLIGISLLFLGACKGASPDETQCFAAHGLCVAERDAIDAGECIEGAGPSGVCPDNFICCIPNGGYGVDAGASLDTGAPMDSGNADAAAHDAARATDAGDARPSDGGKTDASDAHD